MNSNLGLRATYTSHDAVSNILNGVDGDCLHMAGLTNLARSEIRRHKLPLSTSKASSGIFIGCLLEDFPEETQRRVLNAVHSSLDAFVSVQQGPFAIIFADDVNAIPKDEDKYYGIGKAGKHPIKANQFYPIAIVLEESVPDLRAKFPNIEFVGYSSVFSHASALACVVASLKRLAVKNKAADVLYIPSKDCAHDA